MTNESSFQKWIQTPHPNTTPDTNPGPPVSWNEPSNPDDPHRLVMVTLPTTLRKRKPSSIIVTTLAARPTSLMTTPTSPSMMFTYHMASY